MKNSFLVSSALVGIACLVSCANAQGNAKALQTFTIKDHLSHRWKNEIIHFDFNVPWDGDLTLTDAQGKVRPTQFTDLKRDGRSTRGTVWTIADLEPNGQAQFQLRAGKPNTSSDLHLEHEGKDLILSNSLMALRLPHWSGVLTAPRDLTTFDAPIIAVRGQGKTWLGGTKWFHGGKALPVGAVKTEVLQRGPVRIVLRQKITLADGRFHATTIELGAQQDAAIIHEDSNINRPDAGWRLSMQPGLNADHVFWNNQWKATENAGIYSLANTAVKFDQENVVAKLRPWSFWWNGGITIYAGFYRQDAAPNGANPFVGVLMMNPSKWAPGDWDGFDRLEIPIIAGPDKRLEMDFKFLANTVKDAPSKPQMIMGEPDPSKWDAILKKYKDVFVPLHREWAITVGTQAEHVRDPKPTMEKMYAGNPEGIIKMRRQLLKYSEFPLDEVKDYGFDFKSANADKKHPFLLIHPADIARTRRLAKTDPALKAQVEVAEKYVATSGAIKAFEAGGAAALQDAKFAGIDYIQKLPEAYLGSDDPIYGKLLAAAVKNLTYDVRKVFIEVPNRPALASYGPWPAESFTRLLFAYDLVAGTGLLSPAEEKAASDSLVFAGQLLSNPDYWSLERGLSSANPNMTSMIRLPLGLVGLYLAGHPRSEEWARQAEDELKRELSDWIGPNGAWIESPGYQGASLDGILLYATAVRNVHGRDYFQNTKFKAMMEYFGFLLTPPDPRLPVRVSTDIPTMSQPGAKPPAALVSIGDTPVGSIYPFNGWMAAMTAKTDPEYSRRQQFFWKIQNFHFNTANRAKGMTVALNDVSLPAQPPKDLSRGFPGFGSIMRSSWTDPNASYLAHRTGPFSHHYHQDFNSIDYRAKGAPLCLDFANQYQPVRREEPWYHNRVSFNIEARTPYEKNWEGVGGDLVEMQSLPSTVDYSYGKSFGWNDEEDHRYILMIKSADPMGANYVVMRDKTEDGKQADQPYYWNLWCLSKEPQISGNVVHFPGQLDVDLDVHLLSPAAPKFTTDFWQWKAYKHVWAEFEEAQYGIRVPKIGSNEDYLAVLYPRARGQAAAHVSTLAGGAALRIGHMEGTDTVLLSPGKPVQAKDGEYSLQGEIAFARRYNDGGTRLAVIKGASTAACGDWSLSSNGAVSLQIKGDEITGESSGAAHEAKITLSANFGKVRVLLDGKTAPSTLDGRVLTLSLPTGDHTFLISKE